MPRMISISMTDDEYKALIRYKRGTWLDMLRVGAGLSQHALTEDDVRAIVKAEIDKVKRGY